MRLPTSLYEIIPAAPTRAARRAWASLALMGVLTAALAAAAAATAGWGERYVLGSVGGYGLIAGAAEIGLRRQRRRPNFRLAAWVTLFRAALISTLAGLLALEVTGLAPIWGWTATAIAALALALDAVDGWVARRFGQVSKFGALLDQELDAFFIMVLSLLVWRLGQVDAWVLLLGAMRYLFLMAGWLWPRLARPLPASRRRRAVCGLQVAALVVALAPPVGSTLAGALAAAALAALVYSFAADTAWLLLRADGRGRGGAAASP